MPEIYALRHTLHMCPETAFKEYATRSAIVKALSKTRCIIRPPLLGTGIIADLAAEDAEKTICLRADLDALPIPEESGLSYASRHSGFMHACGHDGHSAILVATALVLSRLRKYLRKNVRFVFQPAEEMECGGSLSVKKGALRGVSEAYALHCWPGYPVGSIVCKKGYFFAANGSFTICVRGKSAHGALPEKGKNPIPASGEIALRLNELHAKMQKKDAVVSVCMIHAGTSANVIPGDLILKGTTRFFEPRVGELLIRRIRDIARSARKRYGLKVDVAYESKYHLPVFNSVSAVNRLMALAKSIQIPYIEAARPFMTSEDFAFYLNEREGALFLLGQGKKSQALHSSRFDFNDESIAPGVRMFSSLALSD